MVNVSKTFHVSKVITFNIVGRGFLNPIIFEDPLHCLPNFFKFCPTLIANLPTSLFPTLFFYATRWNIISHVTALVIFQKYLNFNDTSGNVLMFPSLKEKIKKCFGITFISKMKIKTFFINEVTSSRGTRKEF